ncbi:hypothetical protein GEMRC1_007388 [Eukaryota sp. GEM-RC1]
MFFLTLVGLTGGIASGKSTVSSFFGQRGAAVIDSDQIARDIVKPNKPAFKKIVADFGDQVLSPQGDLDRAKLGTLIFQDPEARKRLNSITHPRIIFEMVKQTIFHWLMLRLIVIWDTPLLIETGLHRFCDSVVVVFAEPETQLERLMKRDGLDKDKAMNRIFAQMLLRDKCRLADYVINNNSDLSTTCSQVSNVFCRVYPSHPLLIRICRILVVLSFVVPLILGLKCFVLFLIRAMFK